MSRLLRLRRYLWRRFEPARRNAAYFARRRLAFGIVASLGFPLYGWVWAEIFPQPYENLGLRLIGSLLFLPIVFVRRLPERWERFHSLYWYLALLYALPFFFAFMLLKNAGSVVWVESALVAIFVMVLLLDWLSMIVLLIAGVALAWGAYVATTPDAGVAMTLLEQLPVVLFAMVIGTVSNYATEVVRVEQERAMLATAGSIAHELRTPLLSIKSGASGLRQHLPNLIAAYRLARAEQLPVEPMRAAHLDAMAGVLQRIELEVDYSNSIMEMLIANVREAVPETDIQQVCSLATCLQRALERYPFLEGERRLVSAEIHGDISFRGSELLMVHVLFNLLKNALRHIGHSSKGHIEIRLEQKNGGGQLAFRDTGPGISPEVLPHVFKRFFTAASDSGLPPGSGIGLAYCRDVMTAIGGTIECATEFGHYTEFILTFPELTT